MSTTPGKSEDELLLLIAGSAAQLAYLEARAANSDNVWQYVAAAVLQAAGR